MKIHNIFIIQLKVMHYYNKILKDKKILRVFINKLINKF